MDEAAGLLQSPVENLGIRVSGIRNGGGLITLQAPCCQRCPSGPAAAAAATAFRQGVSRCADCGKSRFIRI